MKKMHPWMGKGLALGAVGLVLMAGLGMVAGVVQDRVSYRQQAVDEVTQSLAGPQSLMGPVLAMSCTETWTSTSTRPADAAQMGTAGAAGTALRADGLLQRTERATRWVMAPPANLTLTGKAGMQHLKRNMYAVGTYTLGAQIKASWPAAPLAVPKPLNVGGSMQCETPVLFVAVSDARGLRSAQISLNGQTLPALPGTTHKGFANGFHVAVPQLAWVAQGAQGGQGQDGQGAATAQAAPTPTEVAPTAPAQAASAQAAPLQVSIALDLLGTQQLALVPIATDNQFQLASSWPHPSFGGRFLPSTRQVSAQGFDASWRLSALATRAQQQLQSGGDLCSAGGSGRDCLDTVNVDFIDPVDTYVLSDRATKYGVLFIFLTFVAVGLVELLGRVRVHPVQYGLVGAALCSFFLLLLSLSEHLPFELAYAAAGAACVTLLGYYASFILGDWRRGLPFGGLMALMYGLLYVLLRLEQTSLIVGSLALFVVLTVIMVATRQVDWYALVGGPADQDDAPTA